MHPREGGRKLFGQPVTRRSFLQKSAVIAAAIPATSALLAACKPRQYDDKPFRVARKSNPITYSPDQVTAPMIADGLKNEAGPLEIYNWEEYINPRIVGLFEQQYGVKVNITTFTTMVDAITKLTTREQNYDVFIGLTKDFVGRCILLDLLRPLNHSYLPNLANMWDSVTGLDGSQNPFYDVGDNFTVPYTVYTTGVGYRIDKGPTDHITVDLSDLEAKVPAMDNPYDLLWDPKYKGFSHMLDDYREAMGMAMVRRGRYDVNTDDPSTRVQYINDARDDLVQAVKACDTKFDVNDYIDMPEGRAYVHQSWSGDLVSVQYYYPSWSNRDMIRYWYPPQDGPLQGKGVIGNDTMAILANGKNPALAHTFLNFMLDFDNSLINFKWNGYVPPLKKITDPLMLVKGSKIALNKGVMGAKEWYAATPPGLANCIPLEADFKTGVEELELTPEVDGMWKDAWEIVQTTA
jgi:spermidine/putrescine transport system substrate-binding protein